MNKISRPLRYSISMIILLGFIAQANAIDVVFMKDGTKYAGDVIEEGEEYVITSPSLGVLRLPKAKVASVDLDQEEPATKSAPNAETTSSRPALRNDPDTRRLIHDLKYNRRLHLAAELGRLATEALSDPRLAGAVADGWPLVPVPLHRSRQHRRHFNQALEIARTVARLSALPLVCALRRTRDTGTQTRLSRSHRLANLRGAFRITAAGRRLVRRHPDGAIIFDDVFTTGATTHECASVLRRAGLENVVVVTVMRG